MARIMLVTQPTEGGVFRHVADLATGLADRGHHVVLVAPLDQPPAGLPVELVAIPMARAVAPAGDARALAALARAVRRARPDLVHGHSSKAGALTRLARPVAPRTPVVYTPHGYAFAGHFDPAEQRRYRRLERPLARLASRVLCVCRAEARLAASVGPAGRTRVVHNGVHLPPLPPSPGHGPARDRPVVMAVTQLRPGKGLETLIDAMPAVLRAHPGARLRIVGDGPDRAVLQARAEAVGEAVELVPFPADPLAAMAEASVFVHPSWAEAFPYAVLDAMALGLPVVASDVGGVGEAVETGASGLLVPPRDPAALAAAVSRLLADPATAAALGAAARARVADRFTVEAMVEGTLAVYRELLE
jgi:glycosyltransferase involved in cell wall biosynthesis